MSHPHHFVLDGGFDMGRDIGLSTELEQGPTRAPNVLLFGVEQDVETLGRTWAVGQPTA
jgi:hypothetical protein